MSEIQFGEVREAEPSRGLRPDEDAQYCVRSVRAEFRGRGRGDREAEESEAGWDAPADVPPDAPAEIASGGRGELRIYVALDVMRAMESHASSNTRVELGGVLLGTQQVDSRGRPFVVVSECLQAEHYEATRGSFKFTHDTWSQITDQRARFRPDLEMVGWYHTHPGWGIFLSGMDLFICRNFFNRPLDIALVIDPVAQERGWFFWEGSGRERQTRPTQSFYLFSNRYRESELDFFARQLAEGYAMNLDSRFPAVPYGGGSPVVNISDNRRPLFEMGLAGMLFMQFLFLGLIAWRILVPAPAESPGLRDEVGEQAYAAVLDTIVERQTGEQNLVSRFAEQRLETTRLASNLDAQILMTGKLQEELESGRQREQELRGEWQRARSRAEELAEENRQLRSENGELGGEAASLFPWKYVYWGAWGLLGLVIGTGLGIGIAGRRGAGILVDHADRDLPLERFEVGDPDDRIREAPADEVRQRDGG